MAKEFQIITSDNLLLRGASFPATDPKGSILMVHGLGDHMNRYPHVIKSFNEAGFTCFIFDLRGHGQSDGKRGYVPHFDMFIDDLYTVISKIKNEYHPPLFLYGHSMGGNIVANYLINKPTEDIKAAILSSPWIKLSMKAPAIELMLGKFMLKVAPSMTRSSKLDAAALSHDQEVIEAYVKDPLVHDKVTPSLFFGGEKAAEYALTNSNKVKLPLLVTQGNEDKIVDYEGSRQFAENGKHTFHTWEGGYHEPHNDNEREKVIQFYIDWFKKYL